MGQTSSSGVDYTFGLVANYYDKTTTSDSKDDAFSTWTTNERLLRYPQYYGLENDSYTTGYDSDDELGSKRLSTPSTSSTSSMPLHSQHHTPFYIRTSIASQCQNAHGVDHNTKHTIERIDSGYADQDVFFASRKEPTATVTANIDNRLAQDIRYVDELYYTTDTHRKKQHQQDREFNLFTTTNDNTLALNTGTLGGAAKHRDNDDDDIVNTIGTKLTFAAAALASQDPTMRDICLSRRSLIYLDTNIGLLTSIRKLNLCNNMLKELPSSIGQLKQLEVLTISKNQLRYLPDSIQYLPRLTELDVSYNQLDCLPSLNHLSSLCTLLLSHNQLTRLPSDLTGMKRLVTMDLTNNPLSILPAEITRLSSLRRLRLDHCQKLMNRDEHVRMETDLTHDPPSLLEICARKVLLSLSSTTIDNNSSKKLKHSATPLPAAMLCRLTGPLLSYLASANICSSCNGPYFESYVIRRRLIEKNDVWIPLEYTLCSAHWSNETDRLLNMFHRGASFFGDCNNNAIANTIASIHTLAEQQQQQLQLSPSASLCMDMDELDAKPTGKMGSFMWRHPQRLQRVRNNKNPSSFLIPKIHRE